MEKSQLLILGNGFDLHCGLKSSYKDFFRSEILDTYMEMCGYPKMKANCRGFWESLLYKYYEKYGDNDYNWCDTEAIIKDTLLFICYGKDNKSTDLEKGMWKKAFEGAKVGRYPAEASDTAPIYSFISQYCTEVFSQMQPKRTEIADSKKLNSLLTCLLQELKRFEIRFCKYLKDNIRNSQNEKEINTTYILNAVNLLALLTGFSKEAYKNIDNIIHQEEKQFEKAVTPNQTTISWKAVNVLSREFFKLKIANILSFNYTMIFDILGVECPCNYVNVHGKLCSEQCKCSCNSSSVIFGIDDRIIQAQANTELRLFSKTYRKILDNGNPISVLPPNDKPVEIIFYGHSLSEADYSYFQSIFDYYDLYGNNDVSLKFCYSKGYEQHDAIYKLIGEYGKTLNNREQGKNLIHKLLLENRLHIQEIA